MSTLQSLQSQNSGARAGAIIDVASVRRFFPESGDVLANISLKVESGAFVALLGPSGCGKSTLLRLIAGLDQANEGSVRVETARMGVESPHKGVESTKGFVFQEAHLLPWKTVLENVALPLQIQPQIQKTLKKTDSRVVKEKAESALRRVGLEKALHLYPSQLSGGMKMRVSVARALVTEPELLLLDEPFAALDEGTRFQLQEDLRRLWLDLKMTVVFVTHSVSEAVFVSNRVLTFSPKPARITSDILIDLPIERTNDLRYSAAYQDQVAKVGVRK